jgi:hypothetical protein
MKNRILSKIAALMIVAVIAVTNTIPAYAVFGPSNNQAGALSTYVGDIPVVTPITANPDNKIIVTLPDADLSTGTGGSLTNIPDPIDTTITFDDVAKTVTFAFDQAIAGASISVTIDNISSPVGTHPYIVEAYSGETGTTTTLESGDYTISDNGLTVNLNVAQFFSFGLTTDSLNIDLGFIEASNRTERAIDWRVSTNADSYVVSCRLKTPFTNGSNTFPAGKPGYTPYSDGQGRGIYIGNTMSTGRTVPELVGYYTGISESSMTISTGHATDLDQDRINLILISDATIRPGTYTGVIEFTGTPTF